ncbi:Transcriptional adapter 3, partial [Stegodyphus mimosarum]
MGKDKSKEAENSRVLQCPDLTPVDVVQDCPKYDLMLQQAENICIGPDDLQALQFELENVLVNLTKREECIRDKLDIFENSLEKKPKKSKGKLSSEHLDKKVSPAKKFKDSTGKAHTSSASGRVKSKNVQALKVQEHEFQDPYKYIPKEQKNDSPSRFWALIEPYCAEITMDDIKAMEEWINSHKNDEEYQSIPPLGTHFASQWPQEDIQEEMREGSKTADNQKGNNNGNPSINTGEAIKLLKKIENEWLPTLESQNSPLTERLVSSLVEENLMTSLDDSMAETCEDGSFTNKNYKQDVVKSDSNLNGESLEQRIQKELVNIGALEANHGEYRSSDEVFNELKRLQAALIPVCEHNIKQKKKLLALAKAEMAKQEVKKKLQEADARVMEAYRNIAAAKYKGKKLSKKERDQAMKIIKDRELLMKQLNSM